MPPFADAAAELEMPFRVFARECLTLALFSPEAKPALSSASQRAAFYLPIR
jgi:hypothetical protein